MAPGPYKLTPATQAALVEAFTVGAYRQDAAAYAGITDDTLRAWLDKGEAAAAAGDTADPLAVLWQAVQAAQVACKVDIMKHWHSKATKGKGYLAARDFMRARYPDEWGAVVQHTITQHSESTIQIAVLRMDMLPEIARLLGGAGPLLEAGPDADASGVLADLQADPLPYVPANTQ